MFSDMAEGSGYTGYSNQEDTYVDVDDEDYEGVDMSGSGEHRTYQFICSSAFSYAWSYY